MGIRFLWAVGLALLAAAPLRAQTYSTYIGDIASGDVYQIQFDGRTHTATVAAHMDGEHPPAGRDHLSLTGIALAREYGYAALSSGRIARVQMGNNAWTGAVAIQGIPTSMQFSPATGMLFVTTQDDGGGASVVVIDPETMTVTHRPEARFVSPGFRFSSDGRHLYATSLREGSLYEIDAGTFEITRSLPLHTGQPPTAHQLTVTPDSVDAPGLPSSPRPASTWIASHPTRPFLYVAHREVIVEIDTQRWTIGRRFKADRPPFHLAVTPDGRYLIATQREGDTIGFYDLNNVEEVVRVISSRPAPHGIALSPDSRYAFISNEGAASGTGSLDVIDLWTVERVATLPLDFQAGPVAFWKMGD